MSMSVNPNWRAQYERVHRWHGRLSERRRPGDDAQTHELRRLDFARAFFIECFHLADWLAKDSSVRIGESEINRLVQRSEWLKVSQHITNDSKHAVMKSERPAKRDGVLLLENGDHLLLKNGQHLRLEGIVITLSDGREVPIEQVATECLVEWDRILRQIGAIS
jgi:hypothetical protein